MLTLARRRRPRPPREAPAAAADPRAAPPAARGAAARRGTWRDVMENGESAGLTAWAEPKLAAAARGLARASRRAGAFGGTPCHALARAALALLRLAACARAEMLRALEAGGEGGRAAWGDWLDDVSEAAKHADRAVDWYVEASAIRRCVHRPRMVAALEASATELDEMVARALCLVDAEGEAKVVIKRLVASVQARFASHDSLRDARVRDWGEQRLSTAIEAKLHALHASVLERARSVQQVHERQVARCRALLKRMGALGVDQARAAIRLEPLPHSPRLLGRKQARIDSDLQEELRRYSSVPRDSSLDYARVNNHQYRRAACGGVERCEVAGAPVKRLPEDRHFVELLSFDKEEAERQHGRLVAELAAVCSCTVDEVLAELEALEGDPIGFSTAGLRELAERYHAPSSGAEQHVWARRTETPDRVKLVFNQTDPTRKAEPEEGAAGANGTSGAGLIEAKVNSRRSSNAAELERGLAARWSDFQARLLDGLALDEYAELTSTMKPGETIQGVLDLRAGDCVVVDASLSRARGALRVLESTRDLQGTLTLLSEQLDRGEVVVECGEALARLLCIDDYVGGKGDALRVAFMHEGGVGLVALAVQLHGDTFVEASRAALEALAALARWRTAGVRASLLELRVLQLCAASLAKFANHGQVMEYVCVILNCLAEGEETRDRLGEAGILELACATLRSCPRRRVFHRAHLTGCEMLAHALVDNASNARRLVTMDQDVGLEYIAKVITRVPGNKAIYASACAALARLSSYEPASLFQLESAGIGTILHAMGRFPCDEHIDCHGLVALHNCLWACPRKHGRFIELGALDRIVEVVTAQLDGASGVVAESQVPWRAYMVLCELVRRRRHCSRHTLESLRGAGIFELVSRTLKSHTGGEVTAQWAFRFLRLSIRACSLTPLTQLDGRGDETDDEEYGSDGDDDDANGPDEERPDLCTPAEETLLAQRQAEAENTTRARGESLALFLKRQAAMEAELRKLRAIVEAKQREARLPPLELRMAWEEVLEHLGSLDLAGAVVERMSRVHHAAQASRECLQLLAAWREVVPDAFDEYSAALVEGGVRILRASRSDETVALLVCELLYSVVGCVARAFDLGRLQRLVAEAEARELARAQRVRFDADSVFDDVFRAAEQQARSEDESALASASAPDWAEACWRAFSRTRVLEHLEAARMSHASCPDLLARSLCLQRQLERMHALIKR